MSKYRKYLLCLVLAVILGSSTLIANLIVTTLDQVVITLDGLYVNFNGANLPLESLSIANDGYVVALPKPQGAICPNCGYKGYTPGKFCPNCNFPDDAKVKHAKECLTNHQTLFR